MGKAHKSGRDQSPYNPLKPIKVGLLEKKFIRLMKNTLDLAGTFYCV